MAVISGKGGTGKTSVVASLAALAQGKAVISDCDVDAPDLHLILRPKVKERRDFLGMKRSVIDASRCTACGACQEHCRFDAIVTAPGASIPEVDPLRCEGCGVCHLVCGQEAVTMVDRLSGYACISDTKYGPLVHGHLFPGQEASGKLVSMVRGMSREVCKSMDLDLVIIDGSPGTGCPVIASITGINLALIVTEPTVSGEHDLERILQVTEHFGVESLVCVNRYDLNTEMTGQIEAMCRELEVEFVGIIPYDPHMVQAMVKGIPIVEMGGPAAEAIRELWAILSHHLCELPYPGG